MSYLFSGYPKQLCSWARAVVVGFHFFALQGCLHLHSRRDYSNYDHAWSGQVIKRIEGGNSSFRKAVWRFVCTNGHGQHELKWIPNSKTFKNVHYLKLLAGWLAVCEIHCWAACYNGRSVGGWEILELSSSNVRRLMYGTILLHCTVLTCEE